MSEKGFDGTIDEFKDPGMSYKNFKAGLYSRLSDTIPGEIKYDTATAQNGEKEEVLFIKKEGANTVSVFNMRQLWQLMQKFGSVDRVFEELIEIYTATSPEENIDIDSVCRLDALKGSITARLINAELNAEQLDDIPHIPFLDLAIVFVSSVKVNGQDATITINDSIFKEWDITIDELYKIASKNKKEPLLMDKAGALLVAEANDKGTKPTEDILSYVNYGAEEKPLPEQMEDPGFMVTFDDMRYGATAMTDNEFLRSCAAKFGCGIYIIPCSMHEVMFVPSDDGGENLEVFNSTTRKMVKNAVEQKDILSNHAYYYDKKIGAIIY